MGADRIICIRTDGNSKIAAGHLVRCLSIAQNCLKAGMDVCFLLSDAESFHLLDGFMTEDIRQHPGLSVQVLKTARYDDPEKELPEILTLLSSFSKSEPQAGSCHSVIYLLDSYFVTESYLTAIGSVVKVAYLDDLQLFDYPADLIINYDVIPDHEMSSYRSSYQRAGKALLGASYTPLRSQFEDQKILVREKVSDILITTGGSDPYHFCVELIEKYSLTDKDCQTSPTLHIVIGRLNDDREILYHFAKEYPSIRLHENITDMAALMSTCDLAVSAAGTTLYELCALGIPAISFTMADNQLVAAKAFDETGAIPCAGDIRKEKDPMFHRIFEFLIQMQENASVSFNPLHASSGYQRRLHAHRSMQKLVDGKGAMRIAKELLSL